MSNVKDPDLFMLSYYVKRRQAYLVRRPWWAIWRQDQIAYRDNWERAVIRGMPQDEADLLITASNGFWANPLGRLCNRLMGAGGAVTMVQLETQPEHGRMTTNYVSTQGGARD